MATSPTPKLDVPATETAPEPIKHKTAPLTAEYRKAHKNYVLVAGLLASWELIGIDPAKLFEKWGIQLLSPNGIPLVLYTLLVYCAYKVIIEWNLEDDPRPKSMKAQIDFWMAHAIGAGAVLIGIIQVLFKIRVANEVTRQGDWGWMAFVVVACSLIGLELSEHIFEFRLKGFSDLIRIKTSFGFAFVAALLLAGSVGFAWNRWEGLTLDIALAIGMAAGIFAAFVRGWRRRRDFTNYKLE